MLLRLCRTAGLAIAAVLAALAPVRAEAPAQQRIVAVGDLHGDHAAWTAIARSAGLIDGRGRWAGGRTVLVQMGDIADRGPDSLAIIRHLQALQKGAAKAGGRVIVLVGNHEAMNVIGDLRYVHPGEYAAFADRRSEQRRRDHYRDNQQRIEADYRAVHPEWTPERIRADWMARTPPGMIEHRRAWAPSGDIGRWVLANPAVAVVGRTLFVHGGISPAYASLPVDAINRRVREALGAAERGPQSVLEDPAGPLWDRGLAEPARLAQRPADGEGPPVAADGAAPPAALPQLSLRQRLDTALAAFKVDRIVIGHTPRLGGIELVEDGRLARIDTGISSHYGGRLTYLEIRDGRAIAKEVARPAAGGRP